MFYFQCLGQIYIYTDAHGWFVLLFGLSSLPVHFVTQEDPGDCSHLRPAEPALLQPQGKGALKVPQERDVGVVGGSVPPPSLLASVLPEVSDSR